MRKLKRVALGAWAIALSALSVSPSLAQDAPAGPPVQLPQKHEYQKVLRGYMATLTAKDFDHGITADITTPPSSGDLDYQYRNFILTLSPHPLVGSKRAEPAINTFPDNFTLQKIETPKGVLRPYGWAETLVSLVQWDYPGNIYRDNKALKMRCFVGSAINLIMLDEHVDKYPTLSRTDRIPYYLIRTCAAFPEFKPLLPAEVQKAYVEGVRRLAERIVALPLKNEEPNLDMMAPVGLCYAARVLDDAEFTKKVEDYCRKAFTDPACVHPAGYWVERGGLDINFSGTTNYFATWCALMSEYAFAKATIDKVYRLRAHLMLPEPNGLFTGPSAFNTRTGGAAIGDQWDYKNRDRGAAMLTDEAAFLTPPPTSEQLSTAAAMRATEYSRQIHENPGFVTNDKLVNFPWGYSILANYNFPASVNPGYEFYKKGAYAKLKALQDANSPMLKSPYLRGELFVRDFGKAFVAARRPAFAAILHTGPVAVQTPDDAKFQFSAPLGFGGGQLSAFWTPQAGSVILARRAGQAWDKPFEKHEGWRNLPIHAVSGVTVDGKVVTSGRIAKPIVDVQTSGTGAVAKVSGPMASIKLVKDPEATDPAKARDLCYDGTIEGILDYARTMQIDDNGVSVETVITGDGKDQLAELYETLPVLITDPATINAALNGADEPATTIEFESGGKWVTATPEYSAAVKAVRVTRHGAPVVITFDSPRRAKLSPADFVDVYVSRVTSRAVLVDLLESGDKPTGVSGQKKIVYRIQAAK